MQSGDNTRERIEQAALELFLERGYAGTPLRLIAQAADVTTPALYWHYKSKDDLCFTVLAQQYQTFSDLVMAAIDGGGPEERLHAYVEAFVGSQLRRRTGQNKLGFDQLVASLPEAHRSGIARVQRPLLDSLRELLKSGVSAGVFDLTDVTVTSFAILSMCNYTFTWYSPSGPLSVDQVANSYADIALRMARGKQLQNL